MTSSNNLHFKRLNNWSLTSCELEKEMFLLSIITHDSLKKILNFLKLEFEARRNHCPHSPHTNKKPWKCVAQLLSDSRLAAVLRTYQRDSWTHVGLFVLPGKALPRLHGALCDASLGNGERCSKISRSQCVLWLLGSPQVAQCRHCLLYELWVMYFVLKQKWCCSKDSVIN